MTNASSVKRNREQAWLFNKLIQALGPDFYWPMTKEALAIAGSDVAADLGSLQGRVIRVEHITREMKRLAEKRERMAMEADQQDHRLSAAEQYFFAALFYNFAQGPIHHDGDRLNEELSAGKNRCYDEFIARSPRHIERVEIPFGDKSLPGILHLPERGADGRVPCVVYFGGMDLFKEMLVAFHGDKFLLRGMAVLALDGPGQNEARISLGICCTENNFIAAGKAAMDFLLLRDEIDPKKIGAVGVSMGSFWITQIVAHDHRYAAAAGFFIAHEPGNQTLLNNVIPVFKERYMWMAGITDEAEFDEFSPKLTLEGLGPKIQCPYLAVAGEDEDISPIEYTYKLFDEIVAPKTLIIYEDETHGVRDSNDVRRSVADWMRDRFDGKPLQSGITRRSCRTGTVIPQ